MSQISRRTALLGAFGLTGAALAACTVPLTGNPAGSPSGSSQGSPAGSPGVGSPSATSSTPTDTRPRAPLTGVLIDDPAAYAHAAVAIKVPNLRREMPQSGLEAADIVFVEPNGISYTRFCALFHTKFPQGVNPIRSIRPVDIPLLCPIRPVFGNTGAAPWVVAYTKHYSQYIEELSYMSVRGTGAYTIDPKRVYSIGGAKYFDKAVVAHPKVLLNLAKHNKTAPQQYLPYASSDAEVSTVNGKDARHVSIPWGPGHACDMKYDYDAKTNRYLRSQPWGKHLMSNGVRISTDNILVIRAHWKMDKIYPGGGAKDPVVDIINSTGSFHYFHAGKYVTGTWSKGEVFELFTFTCADGSPLQLAPGQTWVEIPQFNAKIAIKA